VKAIITLDLKRLANTYVGFEHISKYVARARSGSAGDLEQTHLLRLAYVHPETEFRAAVVRIRPHCHSAAQYHAARTEAFRTWAEVTGVAHIG
jgi:hypothetical protein